MTPEQWISYAKTHSPALIGLISAYHPSSIERRQPKYPDPDFPITARNPESACSLVRDQIRESESEIFVSPVDRFEDALSREGIDDIMVLLSNTWFGVPESASAAWAIRGFKEAVVLLENPPYEREYEDEL